MVEAIGRDSNCLTKSNHAQIFFRDFIFSVHNVCKIYISKLQRTDVIMLAIDQTSTEQTCGRTDQNGKKYAQHHIQGQKDQHLGQGEDKSHRYNQHCKKNEMVLGRAYQPPQRRPMDFACHHLETMTRKDDKGDQPSGGETT